MQIVLSPSLTQKYPGACCGFLAVELSASPSPAPQLEACKVALTQELRSLYPDEASIKADPILQAYAAYYKRFKKTYHVALQLDSIALKEKTIPTGPTLVQCMFMAELQNRLLTAGHDLRTLQAAGDRVSVDVAQGGETYTLLRGTPQVLKPNDLFMADGKGIISSIIYGPDQRTQITPETTAALFTVYAPPGIGKERVQQHLDTIRDYTNLVSASAKVLLMEVIDS
jgi:DNA/RNA-binding domain of Phe-tRNA-synthetase-like protein